ncbi:MAG: hypothetical protein HPY81_10085 [Firmicutes bacterium]|nr:hypothetical protein [Bacillota bacterium]
MQKKKDTAADDVRVWGGGVRVGAAMRKHTEVQGVAAKPEKTLLGRTPARGRTTRQAHWYHYWVRPKDDQAQRRLVIK